MALSCILDQLLLCSLQLIKARNTLNGELLKMDVQHLKETRLARRFTVELNKPGACNHQFKVSFSGFCLILKLFWWFNAHEHDRENE